MYAVRENNRRGCSATVSDAAIADGRTLMAQQEVAGSGLVTSYDREIADSLADFEDPSGSGDA